MRENVLKYRKKIKSLPVTPGLHLLPAFFLLLAVITTLNSGQWMAKTLKIPNQNLPTGTSVGDSKEDEEDSSDKENEKERDPLDISSYEDGTYYGTGQGFAGKIDVKVTIKGGKLISVDIVDVEADGESYIKKAKGVIDAMIKTQSLDVDVVSGATYSSNGIIDAVINALTGAVSKTANSQQKEAPAAVQSYTPPENGYIDGTYYGTGKGFGGNITVRLVIQEGKIAQIEVTDAPGEGAEYLAKAKGLIANVISMQTPNVDVVSGASYTSNGIILAIQNALSQAASGTAQQEDNSNPDHEEDSAKNQDSKSGNKTQKYKNGTYYGTGKGFAGNITVKVTIKKNSISNIKVTKVDADGAEFIKKAKNVIQNIINTQSTEVDVITGATYSSNGIILAVQNALKKAVLDETKDRKDDKNKTDNNNQTNTDNTTEQYTDGTYYGTGKGFGGNIEVKVVVKSGKITSITITNAQSETKEFLNMAKAVITSILKTQNTNVDVVTGATYTSKGIIEAVKNALNQKNNSSDGNNSNDKETGEQTDDSANETTGKYKDGTYTGTGIGFKGVDSVKATVVVSNGKIAKITIESTDTKQYVDFAMDIIYDILRKQTPEGVDVIAGATFTSEGILEAVKKALEGALNE